MKLKSYLPDDCYPFTGVRKINPPILVKAKDLPDNFFYKSSLLGTSKDKYLQDMLEGGFIVGKIYKATAVEGYGDVADIIIEINDNGEQKRFMDFLFEDAE